MKKATAVILILALAGIFVPLACCMHGETDAPEENRLRILDNIDWAATQPLSADERYKFGGASAATQAYRRANDQRSYDAAKVLLRDARKATDEVRAKHGGGE